MLKRWVAFRELVPWRPVEAEINPADIFAAYDQAIEKINSSNSTPDDDKLLELSLRLFDNDTARHASINSRAAGMLAAIGLAATLITGIGLTTLKDSSSIPPLAFWSILLTLVVCLAYLSVTTVLSFQIQGFVARHTPDPLDLLLPSPSSSEGYSREVAIRILRYTVQNYKINNRVVNILYVAQKCFRNALVVLVVGGCTAILILAFSSSSEPNGSSLAQVLAHLAGCSHLPNLAFERHRGWTGLCLHDGQIATVFVAPSGTVSFRP